MKSDALFVAKHYRVQGSNEAKMDLIGVQICWIEIFGSASEADPSPDDASGVLRRARDIRFYRAARDTLFQPVNKFAGALSIFDTMCKQFRMLATPLTYFTYS